MYLIRIKNKELTINRLIKNRKFPVSSVCFAQQSTMDIRIKLTLSVILILFTISWVKSSHLPENEDSMVNVTINGTEPGQPEQKLVKAGRALNTPFGACPHGKKPDIRGVCRRMVELN